MAFLDDLKSKHLTNYVLVTIGDNIRISTQNINFDGEYYKPILMNIPSISESLDIEQRKYKISSVTLNISDYEHDGVRFSDSLNTLMNKEVNIYYASMGSKEFTFFGDSQGTTKEDADLYKAGTFIVRSFNQNEDTVSLNCEDLSQDNLHTELPLQTLSDDDSILEKYRGKPIPMVFGTVDRSPCVLDTSGDEKILLSDTNPDEDFNFLGDQINVGEGKTYYSSSLYIFYNESYVNIAKQKPDNSSTELDNEGVDNFIEDTNNARIIFTVTDEDNDTANENLRIISVRKPVRIASYISRSNNYDGDANLNLWNPESALDNTDSFASLSGNDNQPSSTDINDTTFGTIDPQINEVDSSGIFDTLTTTDFPYYSKAFRVSFEDVSNINTADIVVNDEGNPVDDFTYIYYKFQHFADSENNVATAKWNVLIAGEEYNNSGEGTIELQDSIDGNDDPIITDKYSVTDAGKPVYIGYFKNVLTEGVSFDSNINTDLSSILLNVKAHLYHIFIVHSAVIKGIDKYNFFTKTRGRVSSKPPAPNVFTEILSELNFNQVFAGGIDYTSLGSYSFTVDKKINSKKLIEEISQSTSLYPYFKDGEFNLKSIKKDYSNYDVNKIKIIQSNDIINYKYDRTKIEKVYTGVNIKYHYDYGIKDYTRETGLISVQDLQYINENGIASPLFTPPHLAGAYSNEFFGDGFNQELVFESKYIRDDETAHNLAKYLCGLHANQHNLITVTLPLNYINYELGDIVRFDNLIQGKKIFGEDYSVSNQVTDKSYKRNGQRIFKYFFIEQIKKSLDKVEIKLYQLHSFNFDESYDSIVEQEPEPQPITNYYCGDSTASNYVAPENLIDDPLINNVQDDSICTFPAIEGCTDPAASNYNADATVDDGTCIYTGCTNPNASNFNPIATLDDGSCVIVQEYCPLPNFLETNMVNGVDISDQLNDSRSSIRYEPNEELCNTPIDPSPNVLGYCLVNNQQTEGQVSEFECNNLGGEWQTEPWSFGCTDSSAINYDSHAQVDNNTCILPVQLLSPEIISINSYYIPFEQPVYIDAEFTEEVEEQEATGEFTVPDYELVTDERDRTFEGTTSKFNNSTFRRSAFSEMITGNDYIGFRFLQGNSMNHGINTLTSRAKWLQNISMDQVFKVRLRLRATHPQGSNFYWRILGIRPCLQDGTVGTTFGSNNMGYLNTSEFGGVNNGNFTTYDVNDIVRIGGNSFQSFFFRKSQNSNKFSLVLANGAAVGVTMEFDYIQLIPANEQYYEEIAITDNIPYQPPSVTHPRLELGTLGSQNLINPHPNVSLNNIHKIEILDSKENIYYEETITGLPSLTREVLLNPYSLPLNEELTLKFTAINQDNEVNYFLTNEASDIVNFMWRDETGNLNEILELRQQIIDDYTAIYSIAFDNVDPTNAQIQQYDFNNDGFVNVADFFIFTESVMLLIESLEIPEISAEEEV